MDVRLERDGAEFLARREEPGRILVVTGESGTEVALAALPEGGYRIPTDHGVRRGEAARDGDTVWVRWQGRTYRFKRVSGRGKKTGSVEKGLSAPMPGQVQKVLVAAGDAVEEQQPLLVVEAMKMQIEIKAPRAGRVKSLLAGEGDPVPAGAPLVELEEAE